MSINSVSGYAPKGSFLDTVCRPKDNDAFAGNFGQRPNIDIPVDNVRMNSVPYSCDGEYFQEMPPAEVEGGESIVGSSLSGAALMGPIMARHTIAHPIKGLSALKSTSTIYSDLFKSGALKNLTSAQQAEVYKTLFKNAQLGAKVTAKTLQKALAKAQKAYIDAIKAGDTVKAAEQASKINSIIDNGRKGLFSFRKTKTVKEIEKIAQEASKVAKETASASVAAATKATARVAEATTKTGKALAYGKNALQWTKSSLKAGGAGWMAILEGLLEAPEVITSFADGGFGEGVKQTTKSAVKVGASTLGWCVGFKGGAAIGAAIGSVVPGLGTAIGGALGALIGGIGTSIAAGKIAKAVTGKSYSEKKQEALQNAGYNYNPLQPSIDDIMKYRQIPRPNSGMYDRESFDLSA